MWPEETEGKGTSWCGSLPMGSLVLEQGDQLEASGMRSGCRTVVSRDVQTLDVGGCRHRGIKVVTS